MHTWGYNVELTVYINREVYDIIKVMVETKKEQKEDCDRISQGPRRREKTIKGLVKRESGGGAVRC